MPQPGQPQPRGEDWLVREVQELKQALREKGATDPFAGTALSVTPTSLTVNGSQTINGGPLAVNGNTAVSGTFDVGGAATFYVATALNGPAGIYGHATFTGGATFSSDAAFTGYTTFSGAMFNGAVSFAGNTTTAGAATFNGGVTVASNASFTGSTTVAGATFTGGVNFNAATTFSSSPTFSAAVNMPGGATVGGTLASSTASVSGTLTAGAVSVGTKVTSPNADITGTLNVKDLYVTGIKGFFMPHPDAPASMSLIHAATESDRNGVEYWGAATTGADGAATVTLPGYFEALTNDAGRNIQLTPAGRATVIPWASDIAGGKFTINADPGLKIDWLVKAERQRIVDGVDALAFEPEQNQPLGAH